jgi:hypothetical protein
LRFCDISISPLFIDVNNLLGQNKHLGSSLGLRLLVLRTRIEVSAAAVRGPTPALSQWLIELSHASGDFPFVAMPQPWKIASAAVLVSHYNAPQGTDRKADVR